MFTFTCESCAARLKVKQASLIGQVLACPKCGAMVKVIAPANWDPTSSTPNHPQAEPHRAAAPGNLDDIDFDEIEDLIRQAQDRESLPKKQPRHSSTPKSTSEAASPAAKSTSPMRSPKQSAHQQTASKGEPTTPSPSTGVSHDPIEGKLWVNPETRRRQQRLLIVAGLVVGVVVVVVMAVVLPRFFWNAGDGLAMDGDPPSVQTAEEGGKAPVNDRDGQSQTVPSPTEQADENNSLAPDQADPSPEEPQNASPPGETAGAGDSPRGMKDAVGDQPSVANGETRPVDREPSGNPGKPSLPGLPGLNDRPDMGTQDPEAIQDDQTAVPPLSPLTGNRASPDRIGPAPEVVPQAIADNSNQYRNILSDLAPLISSAGTTWEELDATANARDEALIGLPSVFVAKDAGYRLPAVGEIWARPVPRLQYVDVPLISVIHELSRLVNLPIGFSRDLLNRGELDLNRRITFDTERKSLQEVLDQLFADQAAVSAATDWGVEIRLIDEFEPKQTLIDLPLADNLDETQKARFVDSVKKLIQPDSWLLPASQTEIQLVDGKLSVTHDLHVIHQIRELTTGLSAAYQLVGQGVGSNEDLVPLHLKLSEKLNRPYNRKRTVPFRIDRILEELHEDTPVNVLIDWEAVSREGWTVTTEVPGHVQATTVAELLDEITRSMGLTTEVVNEDTLLLTTFEANASRAYVEIYPIGDLESETVKPEMIIKLLNQTVGARLPTNSKTESGVERQPVMCVYEPLCHSVILIAPQPVQRQVTAVLQRLRANR